MALFGVIVLGLIIILRGKNTQPELILGLRSKTVTIFPFDEKGRPEIQYLGEGMVDLISTKLVDPNLVFSKLAKSVVSAPLLEDAVALSYNFGASGFSLGGR